MTPKKARKSSSLSSLPRIGIRPYAIGSEIKKLKLETLWKVNENHIRVKSERMDADKIRLLDTNCCGCELEMPLRDSAATFDFEKAVCSHGLFMMSPNRWDPLTKTLFRPLRPNLDDNDNSCGSVYVGISQPQSHPHSLLIRVYNFDSNSLTLQHQQALQSQVRRMLRLSEAEERQVREFQKKQEILSGKEVREVSFSGRVFRSPTLFEDMVKCILLCNCQWSRTLSMTKALCELQWEMQNFKSFSNTEAEIEDFIPTTPAQKQSKKKPRASAKSMNKFREAKANIEAYASSVMDSVHTSDCLQTLELNKDDISYQTDDEPCQFCKFSKKFSKISEDDQCLNYNNHLSEGRELWSEYRFGNFPSPRELAVLDGNYLAKRCNLGYRAGRILKLARSVIEGRIQLRQLEEIGNEPSLDSYNTLAEQLQGLDGFGPFTCANVLMCMGFYHVIPTDTETIRHIKQVHVRESTIKTVQKDVEEIYGKYAPFQFLAYWSELWHFYEERFGKLSKMAHSSYYLITASNMRSKVGKRKRT